VPPRRQRGQLVSHADVFTLDLHRALVEQLPEALNNLARVPLTESNLDVLGDERGVYQLFEREQPVYIGKSELPLRERLGQHLRRCSGRLNISVDDMAFRCLYVDAFVDAAAPERLLIESYRASGLAPWNVSEGFAPKDVGRERDGGKPGQWFLDRPVDFGASFTVPTSGRGIQLLTALELLKEAVPFDLFRFASRRSRAAKDRIDAATDYPGRYVTLPTGRAAILAHLRPVMEQLPPGWQATVLPPGVILYKERHLYGYALDGWRHTEEGVQPLPRGAQVTGVS